jgi:signal transduction histidine kinase
MAAAFRESVLGMLVVLAGVTLLTVGLVWVPLDRQSPALAWESFAAVTISLIFVAVAVIVRMLAVQLWAQRAALEHSLLDLATARDRLVREEKLAAIGRLSAAIAHEVRNPVSMIRTSVGMARRPGTAPAVRDEVLGIIEKESHRLERMTGDFLAYAREKPPEVRSTSLAETVSLVAGLCRPRAEVAGVTLATECDDATVRFDPFQIHQALLNVALNGIEATPAGGSVKLSARPEASGAVFVVENSGPALSPEAASRYGEPFFTTRPGGTGLGLPIAITIAKAHGGFIALVENAPGRVRWQLRVSEPGGARA